MFRRVDGEIFIDILKKCAAFIFSAFGILGPEDGGSTLPLLSGITTYQLTQRNIRRRESSGVKWQKMEICRKYQIYWCPLFNPAITRTLIQHRLYINIEFERTVNALRLGYKTA